MMPSEYWTECVIRYHSWLDFNRSKSAIRQENCVSVVVANLWAKGVFYRNKLKCFACKQNVLFEMRSTARHGGSMRLGQSDGLTTQQNQKLIDNKMARC